jgi:3-dehydroquinate dehydratase type I
MPDLNPRICASITENNPQVVKTAEPLVALFEVRIDLIGSSWRDIIKHLGKPWIACNRSWEEGGKWQGVEVERLEALLQAVELGASIVDVELATSDLAVFVNKIKGKADCLISYHNLVETPPVADLRKIVMQQRAAGADICKVVTTARSFADNISNLELIDAFSGDKIISFAMGAAGAVSRVLCPLAGGYLTYASLEAGKESASGQITVHELRRIYGMVDCG